MVCNSLSINVPGTDQCIIPGCHVKLGRFESQIWTVGYGWYEYAGNRKVCGWFLVSGTTLKPLNQSDLDDIYMIQDN